MQIENDCREIIRKFVLENYLFTDDQSMLDDSTSFLKSGIIDSMGMLDIVSLIENEFGIKVEKEEVNSKNFDSVDNITAYIKDKKNA